MFAVFVSIYPGTYELIWEMKIGKIHEGCNFKFNTKIVDHVSLIPLNFLKLSKLSFLFFFLLNPFLKCITELE